MFKNSSNIFMKLKILLVISTLLIIALTPMMNAYKLKTSNEDDHFFTVTRSDLTGVDLELNIGDISASTIDVDGEVYDRISIQNHGLTSDYGKAELPVISYYIAVPQGAEVIIDYELSNPVVFDNYYLYPAQPPMPETEGYIDPPFTKNESFYTKNDFYPESIVEISSDFIIRGCRIVRVSIYPIIFNPVTKIIKKYDNIDISIDFIDGTNEFIPERLRSIYFQPLFDAFLVNSKNLERPVLNNPLERLKRSDRADFLIIVYDDFFEEILPLAEWRHLTGLETKVVKWSEVGSSSEDLLDYLTNAYNNWELPPSFILIVGDTDHIPVNYLYNHPYHYSLTGTDHWYVAVDGTDYFPDMHIGRISVEDETELSTVVNKILNYSKTPYMDKNWFDDVLLAAYDESGRYFVYTSERIYNFLNPLGYNCNRQYQGTNPPGSTQGVIDAINNGVVIANHRDHGASENDGYSYSGWSYPQFDTTNIQNDLSNGEMYPVMFALHCDSGWFDGETDSDSGNWESIGEIGIRVADKGFVAVIASTRVSYSGYNDELCVGLFDAMWSDFNPEYPDNESMNPYNTEVYRISQVMNYGKFWMYDIYVAPGGCPPYPWTPSEDVSRTTFEMFHVHGDPTMEIWTSMPENFEVTYEILDDSLEVMVMNEDDPVENALVCLSQENGIYVKGLTDETGMVSLNVINPSEEEINMTVTAHNYLYDQQGFFWNRPPEQPDKPSGPGSGEIGTEYEFSTNTTDPEGEQIFYWFDWGDGSDSGWIGPYISGEMGSATHKWNDRGGFKIKVKAKDVNDYEGIWSEEVNIWISNKPPGKPTIKGPRFFVKPGISQQYMFSAKDPEGDQVYVLVLWGTGSGSWEGPINSGEQLKLNHTWSRPQTKYTIRAVAKDIFGYEGEWATYIVNTPKTRGSFIEQLKRLEDYFPIINYLFETLFN